MIYLIIAKDQTKMKIGCSKKPEKRFMGIRHKYQTDCFLYGTAEGNFKTEAELHKKYNHLNIEGEWFKFAEEIKSHFKEQPLNYKRGYIKYKRNPRVKLTDRVLIAK